MALGQETFFHCVVIPGQSLVGSNHSQLMRITSWLGNFRESTLLFSWPPALKCSTAVIPKCQLHQMSCLQWHPKFQDYTCHKEIVGMDPSEAWRSLYLYICTLACAIADTQLLLSWHRQCSVDFDLRSMWWPYMVSLGFFSISSTLASTLFLITLHCSKEVNLGMRLK